MRSKSAALALLLLLLPLGLALAAVGELDGKTFTVMFGESGDEEGDEDTLIFADGMFRSTACDEYGFEPAAYTTTTKDGVIFFEAVAESEEEGTNHWNGEIDGDQISGHFIWEKPGQEPIEYWFEGALATE